MDFNIVKLENSINTEIFIKTEPLDNPNEFLTEESIFTEVNHEPNIKTEIIELNIKSEDLDSKNEVVCDPLDVGNNSEDIGHISNKPSKATYVNKEQIKKLNNDELSDQHQLLKKKSIKTYNCFECGKTFRSNQYLNQHIITHSDLKPFKCDVCGKCFNREIVLKQHRFVHTGIKRKRYDKYDSGKCELCNKVFLRLSLHKLVHGEKMFKCLECKKDFSNKGSFKHHKCVTLLPPKENPFSCDVCEISCQDNMSLIMHKRYHHGKAKTY